VELDIPPIIGNNPGFMRKGIDEIIKGICVDGDPIERFQFLKHLLAGKNSLALTWRQIKFYLGSFGIPVKDASLEVLYDLKALRHIYRVGIQVDAKRPCL
jgi:hypothetical protein